MTACLFPSLFVLCAVSALAEVSAVVPKREGKQIVLGKVARFQAEPGPLPRADIPREYTRGGYVQELRTPAGVVVTDDFAVGHVHHHGVWTAWTKTQFDGRQPDFWNMGQKKGRMEFRTASIAGTTVAASLRAVDMLAQPEVTVLEEQWKLTASESASGNAISLLSTWQNKTQQALKLPKHHYGGFGYRGRAEWNGAENWQVLTSEGEVDRLKANTQRAKWCWLGGKVEGKMAGVVILDHPSNFRHPQPMRVHPSEPFFCYAPQQAGPMEIAPDEPYAMRYRVVAMDGKPEAAVLEKLWQQWAKE
jgi:hypothetical protein